MNISIHKLDDKLYVYFFAIRINYGEGGLHQILNFAKFLNRTTLQLHAKKQLRNSVQGMVNKRTVSLH